MRKSAVAAAVGLALAIHGGRALAFPEGGQLTAGKGSIGTPANGSLVVRQRSQHLAIDWLRFGIGRDESVRFVQPGRSAIAVNRVIGNEASEIYGRLSANGQVFLLNPNGVLFAPGSQVDVGGLVASTLDLSSEDRRARRFTFSGEGGSVVNQGTIRAGSYAALLGRQVVNEGIITARLGTVALAAGEQVTLNLQGRSLVGLSVDEGALDALAANHQLIRADGGTVLLTAKATDDILRKVVNNDGIVEARTLSRRDGVIRLEGTGSGITSVDGSLEAKRITVTGDKVGLFDNASLTARGGTILVGGNFQGQGPERNASATFVARGANLDAGNGRVIVWSDEATRYYGTARGKFVEISSKGYLDYRGEVDLARGGVLLLDPTDITLVAAGGTLDAELDGTADPSILFADGGANTTLSVAELTTGFTSGDTVVLQATNNVNFGLPVAMQAGVNLTVSASAFNLSADLSTNVLTVNGTLNHTDGTLSVTSGSVSGAYNFSSPDGLSIGIGTFTLNGGLNWSGSGTISGAGAGSSTLLIPASTTARLTGSGDRVLDQVSYSNHGTTEIDLASGGTLTVNAGAMFLNETTGVVDFVADQNAVTGTGFFGSGGTVRNSSTGTNTVSTDMIQSSDGTWEASTGRLELSAGISGADFAGTTTIVGGNVFFAAGDFNFTNVAPEVDGILNLDGANLVVATGTALTVNNTLNWTAGTISGAGSLDSTLTLAPGASAHLTGSGARILDQVAFSNHGTTEIDLASGGTLTVNLGAMFLNETTGLVDFVADQNAVTGTGFFGSGGTVRNSSTGTNTVSTDMIQSSDGTWQASTGRLELAAGPVSADFAGTTTIVGGNVFFTSGDFTFTSVAPEVDGILNLAGANLVVATGTALTVNDTLNWTAGTISGAGSLNSTLTLAPGATARLTGSGDRIIDQVAYSNHGTTEIDLDSGGTLTVNAGAMFLNETTGVVDFVADQNAVTGTGFFGSAGTVRNSSAGTNAVSTDMIQSSDGTWEASTGRLELSAGISGADFADTTTLVGANVFFTGGDFTFSTSFGGSPDQVDGVLNMDGAAFTVSAPTLPFNGPVNVLSDTTLTLGTNSIVFQNTIDGPADLTITGSGAGTIDFNGAIGSVTPLADLTVTTDQPLLLPQTRVSGNLDVTASEISQFGRVIVGGAATFDGGAGLVELMQLANDFQGVVNLTSTAIGAIHRVTDANDLQLGTIDVPGSRLAVQTGASGTGTGHLTQTQPLTMSQLGVQTLSDTTSNIVLDLANMMSNTTNPFDLENVGSGTWGDVSLRNDFGAGSLALNFNSAWATITGNLSVQALTGINQVGAITVLGSTTLDAGLGTVSLTQGGNDFVGPVSVAGTAATDHRVTDANDLQLGVVDIPTGATLTVQTGASGTDTGHLTQTVAFGTLADPFRGQLRVETLSDTTSDITLNLANFVTNTSEPFRLENVGTGTWGDVRLRNDFVAGDLQLNSTGNWAEITGVLHVQTGAGISQAGPVVVGGAATLAAGMGPIDLQNAGNDFQGVLNLDSTSAGLHRVTDANDLQLGTISLGIGANLSLQTGASGTATGHLTQTVALGTLADPFMGQVLVQTLSNTTSDITLDLANFMSNTTEPFVLDNLGGGTWGDVSLRNDYGAGAWSLNDSNGWATITGNLSVRALTGITQTNPLVVNGTSLFDTGTAADIQLNNNNDFGGTVTLVGRNLEIADVNTLVLAPVDANRLQATATTLQLSGNYTAADDLQLQGNVELAGATVLAASRLIALGGDVAGAHALTLEQTVAGAGSGISLAGSLGTSGSPLASLTIDTTDALDIRGINVSGAVDIDAGGAVTAGTAPIVVGTTTRIESADGILLTHGGNDFTGTVTLEGTDVEIEDQNTLVLAPLDVDSLRAQATTLQLAGSYTVADSLELQGNVALTGATVLTAPGALELAGDVTGAHALTLIQSGTGAGAGISLSGALGTSGSALASLTIDTANALDLRGVNTSGAVDIDAGGPVAGSLGAVVVGTTTRVNTAGGILLTHNGNDFGGAVTLEGTDVEIEDPNTLVLAPLDVDNLRAQATTLQVAGSYTVADDLRLQGSVALTGATVLTAPGTLELGGNVTGPHALTLDQTGTGAGAGVSLSGALGTAGSRLASLTIDTASALDLREVNATGAVDIVATGGNLFINNPIRSLAAGNAIVIAAPGNAIVNSAGGTALVAPNGRWLVYSTSPAGSTEDGLVAAAGGTTPRLYNRPYATNLPASIAGTDNHLVYSNPQALDITANNQSRAYGAANPALTFTATGLVTDDGVTDTLAGALATGATAASSVAGGPYAITQGTLGAAGGYSVSFTAGQLTVTAVPLAVTANDAMRRQGEPNPAFNSSYAGFVLGETPASLGGALAFATPATPASAPGSYAITPLGLTSSNYSIAFVDGTLTVVSAPAPAAPQQPQVPVSVVQQAYIDTLAAIQGNRAATAVPVHFQELVTIENGGMRLPAGLKP